MKNPKTPYLVHYTNGFNSHDAKFSDEKEARKFAKQHTVAEVILLSGEGRGLIGQYHNGKSTKEFADRDWENE